jgi:hypothetical protein
MRLDFRNIGKGLSAIADAKRSRELANEAERYNVTEGAYGEGLQTNIQQVEQMRDQALRDAAARQGTMQDLEAIRAQYAPSIAELQRRSGLTAPEFSIASGQQTFGTREEAARAARPMRAEGLARTYERFGDVDRAEAMRERADAARLRDVQFRSAQLGLEGQERTAAQERGMKDAQLLLSGAEQAGQPITSEFLRVVATQTGANFNQLVDTAAKSLGFTEASATARIKQLNRDLASAANKGVTGLNEFLSANFDPDQSDNIKPEVTKDARGNFVVTYDGKVLPQYGTNKSLNELVARAQGNIEGDPLGTVKTLLQLDLLKAQIGESKAKATKAGQSGLQAWTESFRELMGREPTDEEKAVRLGVQNRPRTVSEADITARARFYIENDPSGNLTVDEALATARRELLGDARPGPTNAGASLVDQALGTNQPQTGLRTSTPAGQQVLSLYNTVVPPNERPVARQQPTPQQWRVTNQDRTAGFYRQQ